MKPLSNRSCLMTCLLFLLFTFPRFSAVAQPQREQPSTIKAKAESGDAEAQFDLALMYHNGNGVAQNNVEALKWLRKSADQGYSWAQLYLGCVYSQWKWGPPLDYGEAVKWIRLAANQGLGPAQEILGDMYRLGLGVDQNDVEAAKWYRKAADQGLHHAQFYLGLDYSNGWGVPKDESEGAKWVRMAADQGEAWAETSLGYDYWIGKGVARDVAEAAKWLRKAAEQGQPDAQDVLGTFYGEGIGVPKDFTEAAKWKRRAANQGNPTSQHDLGVIYANGDGVVQDYVEAYKWFNIAAASNNDTSAKFAAESRGIIAERMTPDQVAEAQRRSAMFVAKEETPGSSTQPGNNPSAVVAVPKSSGSGFFITADGYLLTNFHVIEEASRILVQTAQGTFSAKLVKSDAANDLALLKVSGNFRPLPVAMSRGIRLGDSIFTIGFPNIEVQGIEPKLTRGEINSLAGIQDDPRYFQISTPVQPGNSGGPLVDRFGNVVGIVSLRLDDIKTLKLTGSLPKNVNYALKSSLVMAVLESVEDLGPKLKNPYPSAPREFATVVKEAQEAVAIIIVY